MLNTGRYPSKSRVKAIFPFNNFSCGSWLLAVTKLVQNLRKPIIILSSAPIGSHVFATASEADQSRDKVKVLPLKVM